MKKVLAFDIGGTKIAYAVISSDGEFTNEVIKVTTPKTSAGVYELLKTVIKGSEDEIDGVAIATAGPVNNENTRIIGRTGNLPEGYDKLDFLSLTDKPILLENDANAAAWAEFRLGAAKGTKDAIILTLGTGVGAGIIVNGRLLKGKSGSAGEMHLRLGWGNERKCGCGLYDCLETFVSGNALTTDAKIYMSPDSTSYDVIRGIKDGNQKAQAAFDHWESYLENTLVMMGNLFDPEVIVLSGSMAQFVEYEKLNKQANKEILTQPFVLRQAKFENNAGMLGAALLLTEKL